MNPIVITNFSSFMSRDVLMYSFGDIKLKKPISLKIALYFIVFFAVWSIPLILLFGLPTSLLPALLMFGPPVALATFATRNIWGGRSLLSFLKVMSTFLGEPKMWAGYHPVKSLKPDVAVPSFRVWVSRRRELLYLSKLKESQAS